MSNRMRISRRRVMQMGILAPLAAMASSCEDDTAVDGAITLAGIPKDALPHLKQKSSDRADKKQYKDKYKEKDFLEVASILWLHFTEGVRYGDGKMPADDSAEMTELVKGAYDRITDVEGVYEASGDLVADCVPLWKSTPGHEPVTQYCAFVCGTKAAELAGGQEIDAAIYSAAFEKTKSMMKPVLDKARCYYHHRFDPGSLGRGAGC